MSGITKKGERRVEDKLRAIRAGISAAIAALTSLWGWFGWLLVAWAVCMALDIATGMAAGVKRGEWSSGKAREGLFHKAGCLAAVTVTGVLDLVAGVLTANLPVAYSVFLSPMMVTWYLLTEVGSVIENAGSMGAPIPAWLKKAIAALRGQVDGAMEK